MRSLSAESLDDLPHSHPSPNGFVPGWPQTQSSCLRLPGAEVTRCVPTLTQYLIMKMQLQDKFEEEIYLFIANIMSDNLSVVLAHYQVQ